MSKQAIVDPDELEKFAHSLKQFNQQLEQSCSQLNARFGRLGETWQDPEYRKFAEEYQQTMKTIGRFLQTSEQQIPSLQRKAQHIRAYFGQR